MENCFHQLTACRFLWQQKYKMRMVYVALFCDVTVLQQVVINNIFPEMRICVN